MCCRGAQVIVAFRLARLDKDVFQARFLFTVTHIASTKNASSGRSLLKKSRIKKPPFTDITQKWQNITIISQDADCGGFPLLVSNLFREGVAKKRKSLQGA